MWIAIICLFAIILGWFLRDKHRMEKAVKRAGGMSVKFEQLISILLSGHPECRILKEAPSFICLGVSQPGNITLFDLVMTFGTITITYRTQSIIFGKHKIRWQFPVNDDQEFMAYKINTDIGSYFSNDKKISTIMKNFYGEDNDPFEQLKKPS